MASDLRISALAEGHVTTPGRTSKTSGELQDVRVVVLLTVLDALYADRVDVLVATASDLAESLLAAQLPRRWSHVQAVAAKAGSIAWVLPPVDRDVLIAAAWLHDIGYNPEVAQTGFHPLDGARWLRGRGFDSRTTALVAHHSCALLEAAERGLAGTLSSEFALEESTTTDALWYCDMTTGPDGQDLHVLERLHEARSRYGPDDLVTRFLVRAKDQIVTAVQRTEALLAAL